VPVLRPLLARDADHAGERAIDEGAVDDIGAVRRESRFGDRQRLGGFGVDARRERVRVLAQTAQAQRAIGGRIGRREAPQLQVR